MELPKADTFNLSLKAEDANYWSFRGEGAANLVLAYTGSCPALVGKVIRVQKVPRNGQIKGGASILSKHEQLLWNDTGILTVSPTKEAVQQLYVQRVMSPLLGPEFVDAGVLVRVSMEFLESVERNVLCERPPRRVHSSKVNTSSKSVHLMPDHSAFPNGNPIGEPCVSVEIKPKCGFLPSSKFVAECNAIKQNMTRFKMHEALKLQEYKISELTDYDPLDLFSGSRDRIHKAIKALFASPQNNLRVSLNGNIIYGGLGGGTNGAHFINPSKFEEYLKSFIQADSGLCTMIFIDLIAAAIFKSGVMDRLLLVQKLDKLDIEGAIHAYYNIVSRTCMACRDLDDEKELSQYACLHLISREESAKIVKDFLVSATAKDCSLIISFRAKKDEDSRTSHGSVFLESTRQEFDFKAHFIDLDMKPLKKMEHYYKLDQKIVQSYLQKVKKEDKASKI